MRIFLLLIFSFLMISSYSQNKEEKKKVRKTPDLELQKKENVKLKVVKKDSLKKNNQKRKVNSPISKEAVEPKKIIK